MERSYKGPSVRVPLPYFPPIIRSSTWVLLDVVLQTRLPAKVNKAISPFYIRFRTKLFSTGADVPAAAMTQFFQYLTRAISNPDEEMKQRWPTFFPTTRMGINLAPRVSDHSDIPSPSPSPPPATPMSPTHPESFWDQISSMDLAQPERSSIPIPTPSDQKRSGKIVQCDIGRFDRGFAKLLHIQDPQSQKGLGRCVPRQRGIGAMARSMVRLKLACFHQDCLQFE